MQAVQDVKGQLAFESLYAIIRNADYIPEAFKQRFINFGGGYATIVVS